MKLTAIFRMLMRDALHGDSDVGAAKLIDMNTYISTSLVGQTDNEGVVLKGSEVNINLLSYPEALGEELDGLFILTEHEPENLHLSIRDGGELQTVGRCGILEECSDIREGNHFLALLLVDMKEKVLGDNNTLHLFLLHPVAVLPVAYLLLRGKKDFIAQLLEFIARGFLGIGKHSGDQPLTNFGVVFVRSWYAYGVASAHN